MDKGVNLSGSPALCHGDNVGERHDFDEVFRTGGQRLWRAVYAYAGGRRDIADDAVAEAFARALQHEAKIRSPLPWLYRTAFRIAAAELQRASKQTEPVESPVEEQLDTGELMRAMRALSPSQRAAVYLHYQADLPVREVAAMMGTSSSAVKVHLHRGRKSLAELLSEEER